MFKWLEEFLRGLRDYKIGPRPVQPAEPPPFEIPSQSAPWVGIVWHHSATVDNPTAKDWEGLRKFHMSYRIGGDIVTKEAYERAKMAGAKHCEAPWSDIGYHLGVERTSSGLEVRMGRSWARAGAHAGLPSTNHFNEGYLGFCLIGNFDKVPPSEEELKLCAAVSRHAMKCFGIPKKDVIGHREVYDRAGVQRQKTCPGEGFSMEALRNRL